MQIRYNYANVDASRALEDHVAGQLESAVGRFSDRLTRVEVHFGDVNGAGKSGPADKRCMLEARPSGRDPIAIESTADSFYAAASDAAAKLGRAIASRMDRREW